MDILSSGPWCWLSEQEQIESARAYAWKSRPLDKDKVLAMESLTNYARYHETKELARTYIEGLVTALEELILVIPLTCVSCGKEYSTTGQVHAIELHPELSLDNIAKLNSIEWGECGDGDGGDRDRCLHRAMALYRFRRIPKPPHKFDSTTIP